MKFSIIIPVYNCGKTLAISVDSILAQTYPDWELILVNDGSKDNSLEICRDFEKKDARIRVLDQSNSGSGPARNNGIANATGEYIVFCDADDFYDINALQNFSDEIKQNHPDLVIGNYREFCYSEDGVIINGIEKKEKKQVWCNADEVRNQYIYLKKNGLINAPWTKAYRRELLVDNEIKFADLRRCQDVVFNLRCYEYCKKVSLIEPVLYNYQTPDGRIYLKKFPLTMFDIHKTVYKLTAEKLEKWNVMNDDARRYLDSCFLNDAAILLRLNYQNNWNLTKEEQNKFAYSILLDEMTKNSCKSKKNGIKSRVTGRIIGFRKKWIVDFFSAATLKYQSIRGIK